MAYYRGRGGGGHVRKPHGTPEAPVIRLRLPRNTEVLGLVMGLVGGSRMIVSCKDGKERNARIPGRLKNQIWVREGDIVIVEPWSIEGDKRGDIIWRYTPMQSKALREKGYIR
jgi:translation initiation factor 1A